MGNLPAHVELADPVWVVIGAGLVAGARRARLVVGKTESGSRKQPKNTGRQKREQLKGHRFYSIAKPSCSHHGNRAAAAFREKPSLQGELVLAAQVPEP